LAARVNLISREVGPRARTRRIDELGPRQHHRYDRRHDRHGYDDARGSRTGRPSLEPEVQEDWHVFAELRVGC
jgi:hypothetical protein